jgi:hypothetical protein
MKKVLIIASLLVATVGVLAQGSVNFATKTGSGVAGFCTDVSPGVNALVGSAYLGQLYAGATADSLAPVGTAVAFKNSVATGAGLGWLAGGEVDLASLSPTTGGYFQVRAWLAASGATYEAALASNGVKGVSNVFQLTTLGDPNAKPPGLPVDLIGLQAFTVTGVPEPSTLVLGVLGASLFLLRRRS